MGVLAMVAPAMPTAASFYALLSVAAVVMPLTAVFAATAGYLGTKALMRRMDDNSRPTSIPQRRDVGIKR